MDTVTVYAESVKRSGAQNWTTKNHEAKVLLCEKLLGELKKMDAEELAAHLSKVVVHTGTREQEFTFIFRLFS